MPGERIADQAMFHRIVVDVLDVAGEVVVVADQVFPEAPLPEIVFAAPVADERHAVARQRAREAGLDRLPASGEVGVAFRQPPQGVQIVRQDDDRIEGERPLPPDVPDACAAGRRRKSASLSAGPARLG